MNKYLCEKCSYETNDKSNYNKHLQSSKHNKKKVGKQQAVITQNKKTYKNEGLTCSCGKQFSYASGLSRHKQTCNGININEMVVKLNTEINELKEQLNSQKKQQENFDTKLKQTEKPTQVYISVRQYIQQNYSSAPCLSQLLNYSVIQDNYDDFGEMLISMHNERQLTKYLGDFIIKYYKKDDPKEQSIWNSDVSRLSYIIKRLIDENESLWHYDPKGVVTKEKIIDPLLKYIKGYCKNYIEEHDITYDNRRSISGNKSINISQNQLAMGSIITEIKNGNLANDIVRYIAPYFFNKDFKLLK